jgi:hypothetical protein
MNNNLFLPSESYKEDYDDDRAKARIIYAQF